jgi:hypothetical protein
MYVCVCICACVCATLARHDCVDKNSAWGCEAQGLFACTLTVASGQKPVVGTKGEETLRQ